MSLLPLSQPMLIAYAADLLILIVAIWALVAHYRLARRMRRMLGGRKPDSLESVVRQLAAQATDASHAVSGFEARLNTLQARVQSSINRVGLVRFNPFQDTGSDLSFSLALLNDDGDGIILTSLWARDEVRLYAKPIAQLKSRYALSEEEKQALDLAANSRTPSRATAKS